MNNQENAEAANMVLAAGGLALMVFGAGLLMAHPVIRRTVMTTLGPLLPALQEPLRTGAAGVLPDVERYLKLRAM
jgi:hypothetical protein